MARRKKELLEILRARKQSGGGVGSEVPKVTAKPKPAPSQPKPSPSAASRSPESFPWTVAVLAASLLGIVLWWSFVKVEKELRSEVAVAGPVQATKPALQPVDAGGLAVSEAPSPYSILTITYQAGQMERARKTGQFLKNQAQFPSVVALATPKLNPKFYEIWIGEADESQDLAALLIQVQATEMPDRKGVKPFASARIQRRSRYQP